MVVVRLKQLNTCKAINGFILFKEVEPEAFYFQVGAQSLTYLPSYKAHVFLFCCEVTSDAEHRDFSLSSGQGSLLELFRKP